MFCFTCAYPSSLCFEAASSLACSRPACPAGLTGRALGRPILAPPPVRAIQTWFLLELARRRRQFNLNYEANLVYRQRKDRLVLTRPVRARTRIYSLTFVKESFGPCASWQGGLAYQRRGGPFGPAAGGHRRGIMRGILLYNSLACHRAMFKQPILKDPGGIL